MTVVFDTLSFMSGLERLNFWVFKKIKPYLGKRILEAGCGTGNLTSFLKDREFVLALDNDDRMLFELKSKFPESNNIKLAKYNLEDYQITELSEYSIDTIICINTLEHIKDDLGTLNNFNRILKDGNLIILVPNFPFLYCGLDKAAGHYRRYSLKDITDKIKKSNFSVKKKIYSNFFGLIGWFFNGKVLKKERLSLRLLWLFNFLMPILDLFENLIGPFTGLSIILICKKEN